MNTPKKNPSQVLRGNLRMGRGSPHSISRKFAEGVQESFHSILQMKHMLLSRQTESQTSCTGYRVSTLV